MVHPQFHDRVDILSFADAVVQAAQDAGAQGATVYYGYGSGVRERLGVLGLALLSLSLGLAVAFTVQRHWRAYRGGQVTAGEFARATLLDLLGQRLAARRVRPGGAGRAAAMRACEDLGIDFDAIGAAS